MKFDGESLKIAVSEPFFIDFLLILAPQGGPRGSKSGPKPKKVRQKAGSKKRLKKRRFLDPPGDPLVFDSFGVDYSWA